MIKYLGSKRRLVPVLSRICQASGATTALDLFTGTTRVAQAFKAQGVHVTAVDSARYAHTLSLVANRFLVAMGGNDGKATLGDAWALDTSEKPYQWRKITEAGDMPCPRCAEHCKPHVLLFVTLDVCDPHGSNLPVSCLCFPWE